MIDKVFLLCYAILAALGAGLAYIGYTGVYYPNFIPANVANGVTVAALGFFFIFFGLEKLGVFEHKK